MLARFLLIFQDSIQTRIGEMGDKAFSILGALVTVALVTTIVSRPNSANVIKAFGSAFGGTIKAAQGR